MSSSSSSKLSNQENISSPDRNISKSEETQNPARRKSSSWLHIPNIIFPSISKVPTSPEKAIRSSPQKIEKETKTVEPSSPPIVDKPKPKLINNVSKGVHGFASTVRMSTNVIAEDIFGAHKDPGSKESIASEGKPRDIFTSSLSDVLFDVGRDAMNLMKPVPRPKKPIDDNDKKPPDSPPKPTPKPENKVGNNNNSNQTKPTSKGSPLPRARRSVSDCLELDNDVIDSSYLSTYHMEKSILFDDEPIVRKPKPSLDSKSILQTAPKVVNPVASKPKPVVEAMKSPKSTKPSFASKAEFLQGLTDMPDELLPDARDSTRSSSQGSIESSSFSQQQLSEQKLRTSSITYDDDDEDCV